MPAPQCGSPDPRLIRGGYFPAMTYLLRIAQEIRARDAVVDPDLGAAQAEKYSTAMLLQAPSRMYAS
jgi:hypothetical protein